MNLEFDPKLLQIILPIVLLNLILVVTAMIDLIRSRRTNGPKWLWALLILFVQMFGPICYFVFGRNRDV